MGLKLSSEKKKKKKKKNVTFLFKPEALSIGEGELHLGEGLFSQGNSKPKIAQSLPHLGEGCFALANLKTQFLPFPYVNFRIYYSFVRIPIKVNDRHEIGLIDNPIKRIKGSVHVYKLYIINY